MPERRIARFHDKLLAALNGAGLPDGVTVRLTIGPDPVADLHFEYQPNRWVMASYRTDARNRSDLEPRRLVLGFLRSAKRGATDRRYTDEARAASREFADLLSGWLADNEVA